MTEIGKTGMNETAGIGETLGVNKTLPTPAYLQLTEQLKRAIRAGELPIGSALPSERTLAEHLGLSRMTVRRALEELAAGHLVEQRRGSGTYVLGRRLEQTVDRVQGFTGEAALLGFKPGSVLLEIEQVTAGEEVARSLHLGEADTVLRISRLRTADDEPLALQVSHLAPPYLDLSRDLLKAKGSLYETLREQFKVVPTGAKQAVSARLPLRREREMLAMSELTPVLALERTTFMDARPFEYVRSAYRSDRYRVLLELRA